MNIIDRLFGGGKVEHATVEPAPRERSERDAILAELEGEEQRKLDAQVAQIAQERRQTAEYQARVKAQAAELRGRLNESLDELGDLVPQLLIACAHFDTIAAEVQEKGLGFDVGGPAEDIFGIPHDFGSRVIAAIRDISPRTEWDYSHIGSHLLGKGKKADKPKIRRTAQPTIFAMERDVYGNAMRPGTIDGNTGLPITR